MSYSWLKRVLPRGIYGRAALILIVPIVAIQLVVSTAFIQRHFEDVTIQMTRGVVLELRFVQARAAGATTPAEALERAKAAGRPFGFEVTPGGTASGNARLFYDLSGRVVISTLQAMLQRVTDVDLSNTRRVTLQLETGQGPLAISFDRRRVSASNPHQLLVLMVVTGVLLTLIAFLFLRNQLRPIRRLARAAEAFGRGRSIDYSPSGALEVRAAGSAFLDMRARIERQIEQRTMMLSGVSHDLRTPLTRMKLGLSMLDDSEDVRALSRDVDEMQRILDEFLEFARSDASEGEPVATDVAALIAQVVADARRSGQAVSIGGVSGSGTAMLRPTAIRRAVENLIGNAVRYGKTAEVSVALLERSVRISVEDDGPGIPEDLHETALRPFSRLDSARNQDKGGGVGLGLAITADIARSHGGTLRLERSDRLGGLRADLVIAR